MLFEGIQSSLPFQEEILKERFQDSSFLIGYGSGVFPQKGYDSSTQRQVDFIIGVDNLKVWHERNRREFPEDYKGFLGKSSFVHYANSLYPGYLGFPFVNFEGHVIKYGVVDKNTLEDDLTNWSSLYFAGRLHKPVHLISGNDRQKELMRLMELMRQNQFYALSVALDLSDQTLTSLDLFERISRISYHGDIRMIRVPGLKRFKGFENKNKVSNIVKANEENFQNYYKDTLAFFGISLEDLGEGRINSQDISERFYPNWIKEKIEGLEARKRRELLSQLLRKRVAKSSLRGTSKFLINPGIVEGGKYALAKMIKANAS
jgi:translocator assembly and maintenance protein 41